MARETDEQIKSAKELIQDYEERVIKEMYPDVSSEENIVGGDFSIRRNLGNLSTIHYKVEDLVDGRKLSFVARKYGGVPKSYSSKTSPTEKDYHAYLFLREMVELGEQVPKVVYFKDAPEWLFVEHIEGKTLREKLEEEGFEKKPEFVEDALIQNVELQHKATIASQRLSEQDRERLFWSRSVEEQAVDYLSWILGDRDKARKITKEDYMPLFGDSLVGRSGSHGDLSPDNLIYDEQKGIYVVIDPELKERGEFGDSGSLISYLGDYEDYWDDFAVNLKLLRFRLKSESEGLKPKKFKLTKEGSARARKELYSNIYHYATRIIAKRIRENQEYPEQERVRNLVLDKFIQMPEHFMLCNKDLEIARGLKQKFFDKAEKTLTQS